MAFHPDRWISVTLLQTGDFIPRSTCLGEATVTTALRGPHCYQVSRAARALATCRAVQRDIKAKGHIHAVPGAGWTRPCHPTERPGRRWWASREEAAASEPRGDRVPESLAQQHGRNLGSACSQGSCSRAGPGQPPHGARPGPGCTGRPCRHSAAPRPSPTKQKRAYGGPAVLSYAGRRRCRSPSPCRAPARLTSTARSPWVAIAAAIPTPPAPPPAPRAHGPAALDWAVTRPSAARKGGACARRQPHPWGLSLRQGGPDLSAPSRAHIGQDQTELRVRILRNECRRVGLITS